MTTSALDKVLSEIGYEEDKKKIVKEKVGMMRQFKTLMKETLKESGVMNSGMIDELMTLKEWYLFRFANMDATSKSIKEVFTHSLLYKFLLEREKAIYKAAEKRRHVKEEEAEEAKPPEAAKTTKTKDDGINVSYKVETKEIPKSPANKSLKGKIFDEWHGNFYVKMCQAKVADILEKNYVTPDATSKDYELHKTKDAFLKNHLLTAMMGSNGLEHDEDTALNATAVWEQLKFNHYIKYSAETFLAKMNDCLKKWR
eukprot:10871220-Ditylum_brightwellii.AAC.1